MKQPGPFPVAESTGHPECPIESPVLYWNPSIAVCGIDFVTGDLTPRWRNYLLVGALRFEEVRLLNLQHGRVLHQEILLKSAGRVRDVTGGRDMIFRLTPIRDVNEGLE